METEVMMVANTLLQLICYSAILTDYVQTQQWANHASAPIIHNGDGSLVMLYEGNGGIRGTHDLEQSTWFRLEMVEATPRMLDPPWSTFLLGMVALEHLLVVTGNNENARLANLSEHWMIGYSFSF